MPSFPRPTFWLSVPAIMFWFALPPVVVAQSAKTNCDASDLMTQDRFLSCVAAKIRNITGDTGVVFESSLQRDLSRLSQSIGYAGQKGDLDVLKRLSTRLKSKPRDNQDTITALDNAISAYKDEFRARISPSLLPPDPSLDQYNILLQRKLKYLLSDAPQFYDGGPFEIIVRSNLALSLQEAYFLGDGLRIDDPELKSLLLAKGGANRKDWLAHSGAVLGDIIGRLSSPDHDYLPPSLRLHSVNDFRYRRATVRLALKEKQPYREALKSIVMSNQDFSLASSDIDHVYVYKVFYTPYRLTVISESNSAGRPIVTSHVDDPNTIKRLFNPAQLALASCSLKDVETDDAVPTLSQLVRGLVLSDYYVVIASGNDTSLLEAIRNNIQSAFQAKPERRSILELKVKQLETSGFSQSMKDGAQLCGVPDNVAAKIFSAFTFDVSLVQLNDFGKYQHHLIVGGRLNAEQAKEVAAYFNDAPEMQPALQPARGTLSSAYIARMRAGD